jgi:hypothetical protein
MKRGSLLRRTAADFGSARSQAGRPPRSHSAQDDVEAFFLGGFDEGGEIVLAGEVVVAGSGLVDVPEDVGRDGVEAHRLGHLEAGVPVLAGDAGVVEFTGEDLEGFAVEGEVVALGGEGVERFWGLTLRERRECGEGERAGEKGSVHELGVCSRRITLVHWGECFKAGMVGTTE